MKAAPLIKTQILSKRHVVPATPASPSVYRWEVDFGAGSLCVKGPLARPDARRRSRRFTLKQLPPKLRRLMLTKPRREPSGAMDSAIKVRVGKRSLLVVTTSTHTGYLVDLSRDERKHARVEAYARRLEEGIDALPEAFVLYDERDRLLVSNPQYAELYPTIADRVQPGVSFTEISEAAVQRGQFLMSGSREEWLRDRLEFHRRAEGFFEQQLNNGRWIQLSERRTRSGGTTSIRTDVTLLKQREQELRRAMNLAESSSRAMSSFLAVMSHEVRNGLNGMLGMAQLLALDSASDAQAEKSRMILGSTRGLMTVLSDLLDYLKNEARGVNVVIQPIAPRQLVQALHSEFELEALGKGIELSVVEDPTLPDWIEGDPARIQQVLTNLLSNAIKYSSGGRVTVSVTVVNERIRYEVEDQGPGITKVDLEQLFKLFAQVGPERDHSTGLGLAISKQLVIAMGGDISVRSEPGRGSRFWFDLPLKRCTQPDVPLSSPIAARRPLQGRLRIGVIDDDPLNLYVAEEFLRRLGHEVVVFQDSEAIEQQIEARALDALLLDVMMPGESGTEIAVRLRASGCGRAESIVIVAVTGNVLPENLQHFLDAGFDAVLQKPIFIDQLGRVLQNAMSSRSRVAGTRTPAVLAPGVDGSTEALVGDSRQGTLRRLRADIGDARFLQSVRGAEKVFRALLVGLESRLPLGSLMPMLHRVRGSAPQLGLGRLGEIAGALEDRGQSGLSDGAKPTSSVASDASELSNALRDALVVLEGEI